MNIIKHMTNEWHYMTHEAKTKYESQDTVVQKLKLKKNGNAMEK